MMYKHKYLVKSFKKHINIILCEVKLNFEEFTTVLGYTVDRGMFEF